MPEGSNKIKTTHVGSLIRPDDIVDAMRRIFRGEEVDLAHGLGQPGVVALEVDLLAAEDPAHRIDDVVGSDQAADVGRLDLVRTLRHDAFLLAGSPRRGQASTAPQESHSMSNPPVTL
ncbi:MAG TPA: hypothetical protein VFC22_00990, partial [Solirubrobacteraceae bacterium]|nr:hypothetical protein [Solirubrobacteraceae bacterium]